MKKFISVLPLFLFLLSCGGKNVAVNGPGAIYEPDRQLYEEAMRDIHKSKFTVGRITLQTLINTYPDSDFLDQAKYAMAESFFKENSSTALGQAEVEFKDYITFFPASDLADDAQLKIAMTHIRRIQKHDRDNTQALLAEIELRSMIESYPKSDLLDEAKRDLRAVQEVLADGSNRIAEFYMLRKNYAAAISRFREVMTKYPDYSRMPKVLYGMAEALNRVDNKPEATIYYARIVMEHPLSDEVDQAKDRLTQLNQPIPAPNPVALARSQQIPRDEKGMVGKIFAMFKSRPNVPTQTSAASDPGDASSADDSAAPVRGGTVGAPTGGSRGTTGGGFSIDPTTPTTVKPTVKQPGR